MLFLLFSLTENTDLLNIHFCQQQQYLTEKVTICTGWMSALVNVLCDQLDEETISQMFSNSKSKENTKELIGDKLDVQVMAQKLKLLPYTKSGQFKSKHIQPISHN